MGYNWVMQENKLNHLQTLMKTDPLWYQNTEIKQLFMLIDKKALDRNEKSLKRNFKELLKKTSFYIAETGYSWDQWRLPIEYAVIHHTSSSPTISLRELNILGLRLYVQQYLKDKDVRDQPLYSGHYWHGKNKTKENATFVSYHYLVRPNGKVIKLVDDSAYLWHAGNLEINRKSISIALAGKFLDKEPTNEALESVVAIVKNHGIGKNEVFGHTEVINKDILGETVCPGNTFLEVWKNSLIKWL